MSEKAPESTTPAPTVSGPSVPAKPGEPRRKRRQDKSELPIQFLPRGNPPAAVCWFCAVVGLIPPVGAVTGGIAFVAGVIGRRRSLADPDKKGYSHATAGGILGLLEAVTQSLGMYLLW